MEEWKKSEASFCSVQDPPSFSIPENQALATPFGDLETTDSDVDDNAMAYYFVTGVQTTLVKEYHTIEQLAYCNHVWARKYIVTLIGWWEDYVPFGTDGVVF